MSVKPSSWCTYALLVGNALLPCLVVVLAFWPTAQRTAWRNYWCDDRYLYDQAAQMFFRNGWFADDPQELDAVRDRMPLYPALLVIFHGLSEFTHIPVPAWAIVVNTLALAIAVCVLFHLIWRNTGNYLWALGAALLWPWLPGVTAYTLIQLPEALSTGLCLLACHELLVPLHAKHPFPWPTLRAGLILALATLFKPVFCYFSLPCLILIWQNSRVQSQPAFLRCVVFLAAFLITLSPWIARNYFLWGTLTLTPNGAAHLANARDAMAGPLGLPPISQGYPVDEDSWRQLGIDPANLPARSVYRSRLAWRDLQGHLPQVVWLSLKSLVRLHGSTGVGTLATMAYGDLAINLQDQQPAIRHSAHWTLAWKILDGFCIVLLVVVYGLSLLGVLALRREAKNWRILWWALLMIGYFVLISMPFGATRYRYPAMPGYAVLAAGGIVYLMQRRLHRDSP